MKAFTRKKNIAWKEMNNKIVIIDLNGKRNFHQLNTMASFIWKECETRIDLSTLCQRVRDQYDCEGIDVEADLNLFVNQLHENDLLDYCE